MELEKAIDLFVQGWVYCRRKPDTQLKDFGFMKQVDFGTDVGGRTDEFFTWESNFKQAIGAIQETYAQKDHWLTVFADEEPSKLDTYTLTNSEFLMVLDLENGSFETDSKNIKRVETPKEAHRINNFFDKAAIDHEKWDDPHLHYYVVEENGSPAAHGSYSLLHGTALLDKIFTAEAHRGKGLAKALCRKMLFDAKHEGAVRSVLAASQMGHPLYLKLGYHKVTKMWMFEANGNNKL